MTLEEARAAAKALGERIYRTLWPTGDDTVPPAPESLPEVAAAVKKWEANGGPESLRAGH